MHVKADAFNHWAISFRRSLSAFFFKAGAIRRWLVTGACALHGGGVGTNCCAAHKSFLMKIKYPKKKFHYQRCEQIMHK